MATGPAVEASYENKLTVDDTLALGQDHVGDPTVLHDLGADNGTLTATSVPAVTKAYSQEIALVAGVATINLAALPGPLATTVDFTGLKVQLVKLKAPDTNSAKLTIKRGAALPYNLFGPSAADADQITLPPGTTHGPFTYNEGLADVAAGERNVDLAGTGTDKLSVMLVAG